ncbi:uncharacterized protein BT62DRAFT_983375 [Guyanagaster necrorhizus]|uniref:Ectomycorrhiza-regulated esterase n=1 Tax=Guyanagaster necrorhizus TaxID=856835 RepID=A0A9P8ALD7_9AGAR|nr:uncharacterized protein BT62DRAFT_983375 [Guyanagaster necrorhizus MCA 3950]KAG7439685.1 hypothetical protein BT62DRAFT_983375 [Guyanagaster necrorhizus MCA 3950]
MSGRISSKVFIPSPYAGEPKPGKSTHRRKLALADISHKDYLFLRRLATTLPMDASLRLSVRHFESPGIWRQTSLEQDVLDLHVVTEYLTTYFGYHIDLIVAHSRGTILAVRWLCTTEEGKSVSGFVNVSGRYRIRTKVYPEDIDTSANFDGSLVESTFPQRTDILTTHGVLDRTVPVYDAMLYVKTLSKRYPGTHSLHLMENTDHNCTGRYDEVDSQLKGKLQSGVWKGTEDVKGKL